MLLLGLMLINPAYERYLFVNFSGLYGINILILIEIVNGLILYVGFRWMNRASDTTNRQTLSKRLVVLYSTLTFVLFTLPALLWVLLFPSFLILSRSTTP